MAEDKVQCIACGKIYPLERRDLYRPLKHFKAFCICNWCIGSEYQPHLKAEVGRLVTFYKVSKKD